jgi:regulator of protease activity HflC (stomatin/prohibitin superfamily)
MVGGVKYMLDFLTIALLGLAVIIIGFIVVSGVYVVKQWENAAIIRFGRIVKVVKDPGLHIRMPLIDRIQNVDMRIRTLDLKGQSVITKDNISVGIDAVVFMRIEDAEKRILKVRNLIETVARFAQTSMRDIVGRYDLDELLSSREDIAKTLKSNVDSVAKEWGVDVTKIELQDITLPVDMKRALAVQAEAEREARAVQIKANAELEASIKLAEAGKIMSGDPNAMQLRILSTINDVSKDQSNTIILALPLETLRAAGIQGVAGLSSIRTKYEQGQ